MAISGIAGYMQATYNRLASIFPQTGTPANPLYAVWNRNKNLEGTFTIFTIQEIGRDVLPGAKNDNNLLIDRPVLVLSFYSDLPATCEANADAVQNVMHGFQDYLDPNYTTTGNRTLVTKAIGSQAGYGFDDKISRYVLGWEYQLEITLGPDATNTVAVPTVNNRLIRRTI